ncbi:MAG: restriction endonuclease [Thermoanaerobaculia bacterium]
MKTPSLVDFQISETELAKAKRLRRILIGVAIAWSVIGMVVMVVGEYGWLLLTAPPYGTFIFYYLAKAAARAAWPTFRRALDYESAVDRYEQWWTRTKVEFWQALSGRAFEVELADLYCRSGCVVELTPASDDQGVDIWIQRSRDRCPVQCKAHRRPVGPGAVREFYGAMQHFGASVGVLASVSGFTKGAAVYAAGKGIELLDLPGMLAMQRRLE